MQNSDFLLDRMSPFISSAQDSSTSFKQHVLKGLRANPKYLLPQYFYDDEGTELYEQITETTEYYLTRTELKILRDFAPQLSEIIEPGSALVEFGSGSTKKVEALLRACPDIAIYAPIDTSADMLNRENLALSHAWPHLQLVPIMADFTKRVELPLTRHPRVGFFPGSTIGNFNPSDARNLLRVLGQTLGPNSLLVVGVDLVKDATRLEAAYNDAAGLTARFNKNLLARIRRELGADIDVDGFSHEAIFNPDLSRIEMRLLAREDQVIKIEESIFRFAAGEEIYTESSYKYTLDGFHRLAEAAHWQPLRTFTDEDYAFSVHVLAHVGNA